MNIKISLTGLIMIAFLFAVGCKKDTDKDPDALAYENATATLGGIMYDKFWATESGFDQNSTNISKFNAFPDFFRCKQCHGWDGLGSVGSYINRAAKTTRPNVSGLNIFQLAQSKTYKELFISMKKSTDRRDISNDLTTYNPTTNAAEGDKMPDYSQLLTDAQIWDIVKFLKEEMLDVSQLYGATYTGNYPTGTVTFTNIGKDGNAANGGTYFTANCQLCHGTTGKTILLESNMSVGNFIRSKPNEVQHKVHYGQLGTSMVGKFNIQLSELKDLYKACTDTTNFPD